MKKLLLIIFFPFALNCYSQSTADSVINSGLTLNDNTGKALAEFAIKSPAIKMAAKAVEASRYEWKASGFSWLNNLRASFNLNELNLKSSGPNQNTFYPRYNFNFGLPVGIFFGKETKKAKAQYEGNLAQKDILFADQKELIEVAYQEYELERILLALQETVVQDESNVYTQTEEKFSAGTVPLDVFSAASKSYNTELSKRVVLIRNRNIAKIKLEKLLGMKLEDALKQISVK